MPGVPFLHDRQFPVCVHGGIVIEFCVGEYIFAVDDHAIFFAQVLLERFHGLVEAGVQLVRGIEHGCIGQFEVSHQSLLILFENY
jgi:hypothetical protein